MVVAELTGSTDGIGYQNGRECAGLQAGGAGRRREDMPLRLLTSREIATVGGKFTSRWT